MSITLFGILTSIGFLFSGFYLWLRTKEENLPEDEVFDVYIVTSVWVLIISRAVEIAIRFDKFGFDPLRWLSLFAVPGLNGPAALAAAVVLLALAALKRHWDPWLVLDIFLPAITIWESFLVVLRYWWLALIWISSFFGLLWIEKEYRLWEWYKGRKSSVRPGLVSAAWVIVQALGLSVIAFKSFGVLFSITVSLVGAIVGITVGYIRSGRTIAADWMRITQWLRHQKIKK